MKAALTIKECLADEKLNPLLPEGDASGISPLHWVVLHADHYAEDIVRGMIARGIDVHAKNGDGMTALHSAVYMNRTQIMRILIEAGADMDAPVEKTGVTPMMYALEKGRKEAAAMLYHYRGTDLTLADKNNKTILAYAAESSATPAGMIVALVQQHPDLDVNAATITEQKTALHYANDENIAEVLALPGTVIDPVDVNGETPLFWAARMGRVDKITDLAKAGADVNHRCKTKGTALMVAVRRESEHVVRAVVNAGTDVLARNAGGETARDIASNMISRRGGILAVTRGTEHLERIKTMLSKAEEGAIKAAAQPKASASSVEHGSGFQVSSIVCHLGDGLTCTFNFSAQQVIYCKGAAMTVQDFADVPRQEIIQDAYKALREQGGGQGVPPPVPAMAQKKKMMLRREG
ncbi:MAG: ankyrin repeat domain-containing protein [Alphaproteobacteria bacterium]|nr:ankyrin repeat domain-containing protein [Alphaproteobacteria bacterium]